MSDDGRGPRERLLAAIDVLEGLQDGDITSRVMLEESGGVVVDHLRAALSALAESLGECQVELPYAAMYMVRRPDGRREWCCTHQPAHCDPA